jgi:branched-chain amino acid aminotransferase
LSGVGTLVHEEREIPVGDGQIGPETLRLRNALVAIQQGTAADRHGWLTRVR